MFVTDAARRKALSIVLEHAAVSDSKGKKIDLAEFLKSDADIEDHSGHDHN
jgi:hypothetical protein